MTTASATHRRSSDTIADQDADKFARQDDLYAFPYHHLPWRDAAGGLSISRSLGWGAEYLCYLHHVSELIVSLGARSILDAGCGDGRLFTVLPASVRRRVGADLSPRAIAYARAFTPNAEWHVGPIDAIDEQFDVVTAIEVLEHIPDAFIPGFVRALADRVAPGGFAIVTVPSTVLPLNAKHHRHYDEQLLGEQLRHAPSLELVRFERVIRDDAGILQWSKLLHNRWWSLDVPALRSRIWRAWWNSARVATPANGRHVLAILRRVG
ncbi:MAG: class I SAM-dependent methyltransferase [Gemmatimonadaceae bacterium]|nr:class I SAM-dependent methyltransferase [Gemmatimonadaceae bacterium]MCC6430669.1 class I SAM-dependent methyltransferase [Gemmatimonadaceae bacterium]